MLYERCNGANWGSFIGQEINKNWCDPSKPLSEWKGVTVEHDHVVGLDVNFCGDNFKGACSQSMQLRLRYRVRVSVNVRQRFQQYMLAISGVKVSGQGCGHGQGHGYG